MSTILTYSRDDLATMSAHLDDETPNARVIIVGETLRDARDILEGMARNLGTDRVKRAGKTFIVTHRGIRVDVTSVRAHGLRGRAAHLVVLPPGHVGVGVLVDADLVARARGGSVVAYTP